MEYKETLFRLEEDWQNYLENKGKLTYEDMVLIKELLLKKTPKKPITIIGLYYNTGRIKCPTCNHQLPMKKNCISKKPPILYCDRCGQHLDWED